MSRRLAQVMLCTVVVGGGALLAACGDDDGGGGGSGATEGAKTIDVNAMQNAKGNVTVCMGKDTGGDVTAGVKRFNAQKNGVTVKLLEFSTSADEQRQQFVQRQEARSGECDVFSSDVIWTAEFASQKWLYDLTPYVDTRRDELIPATLETATFDGKVWGMPQQTDAGFIYYRTDQVTAKPATWQEVYAQADDKKGIVYQGAPYEGLTCNYLELAFAAGGEVLSEDGAKSVINSPQNVKALQLMVDGVKKNIAARGVTTYMEEESRRYFESGRATFMRNWPYAYALGEKAKAVKGKFAVMPFPPFQGGGTAGILGGHNQVISAYSENPGAALKWIDYVTGKQHQKFQMLTASQSSTLSATYDDAEIQRRFEFAGELRDAIAQARSRPVSPVYPQVSQAIYKNVNAALSGRVTPEQALQTAQAEMDKALATF